MDTTNEFNEVLAMSEKIAGILRATLPKDQDPMILLAGMGYCLGINAGVSGSISPKIKKRLIRKLVTTSFKEGFKRGLK